MVDHPTLLFPEALPCSVYHANVRTAGIRPRCLCRDKQLAVCGEDIKIAVEWLQRERSGKSTVLLWRTIC